MNEIHWVGSIACRLYDADFAHYLKLTQLNIERLFCSYELLLKNCLWMLLKHVATHDTRLSKKTHLKGIAFWFRVYIIFYFKMDIIRKLFLFYSYFIYLLPTFSCEATAIGRAFCRLISSALSASHLS